MNRAPTRHVLLAAALAALLAAGFSPLAAAQSGSTGQDPCPASPGSGALYGQVIPDQSSYVQGEVATLTPALYNSGSSAQQLSWAAGETVYVLTIGSTSGSDSEAISFVAESAYSVTVPACSEGGTAQLAPSTWDTAGALGSARSALFEVEFDLQGPVSVNAGVLQVEVTASGETGGGGSGSSGGSSIGRTTCSYKGGSLVAGVGSDRGAYAAGDGAVFVVGAQNPGTADVTAPFPTAQRYDFRVYDPSGVLLWQWSSDRSFAQLVGSETVKPGATLGPYHESWPVPAAPGTYRLVGVIASSTPCQAETTFTVGEAVAPPPGERYPYDSSYSKQFGCDFSTGSRAEWESCYRGARERMLGVATDSYSYDLGATVRIVFGNPSQATAAEAPFTLAVLDADRRAVRQVELGTDSLPPQSFDETSWDGRDDAGNAVAAAHYIVAVASADGRYGETTIAYGVRRDLGVSGAEFGYRWDEESYRNHADAYQQFLRKWRGAEPQPAQALGRPAGEAAPLDVPLPFEGKLLASFECAEGAVTGSYVSFTYDLAAGRIDGYTLRQPGREPVVVFTTVAVSGFLPRAVPDFAAGSDNPACRGPVWLLFGERTLLDAHNTPHGMLGVRSAAESAAASFTLPSDAVIEHLDSMNRIVEVRVGDLVGWIVLAGPGGLNVDGTVVAADLSGGGQVFFAAVPGAESASRRAALMAGLAEGKVAAELHIERGDDGAVESPVLYHPGVQRFETLRAEQGSLTLLIEAESEEGQVVVIDVDSSLLRLERGRRLVVLFDGEPARLASGLQELLDIEPGEGARYLFVLGADGVQVLLAIPHFSPHLITLETALDLVSSPQFLRTLAITAGVAVLIVLGAGALAFRTPRMKP